MKKTYDRFPDSMSSMNMYGFPWMEFVTSIPSPMFLVTSYKSNGKPNACMQAWSTFVGDKGGFYAIIGSVYKAGHMYQTLHETGECVLNFPSIDVYENCMATIKNNGFDDDELAFSGLTAEPAKSVNAQSVKECFMNLECRLLWDKEVNEGSEQVMMCLEVVSVSIDEEHLDETQKGRYGKTGFLYNVHRPINPEDMASDPQHSYVAIIEKIRGEAE